MRVFKVPCPKPGGGVTINTIFIAIGDETSLAIGDKTSISIDDQACIAIGYNTFIAIDDEASTVLLSMTKHLLYCY